MVWVSQCGVYVAQGSLLDKHLSARDTLARYSADGLRIVRLTFLLTECVFWCFYLQAVSFRSDSNMMMLTSLFSCLSGLHPLVPELQHLEALKVTCLTSVNHLGDKILWFLHLCLDLLSPHSSKSFHKWVCESAMYNLKKRSCMPPRLVSNIF